MSILPTMNISLDDITDTINANQLSTSSTSTLSEFKEYAWDFNKNDFLLVDGKFVIVEGKEALKIWIWKALHTLRQRYKIYSDKYGSDLDTLIGKGYSVGMIESEGKRLVENCLLQNQHIFGIENFTVTKLETDTFNISCTVVTDSGEVNVDV